MPTSDAGDIELVQRWFEGARRPEVDACLQSIFDDVAESTRRKRPICVASGRCCQFARYGHRLYVTGLETAWCLTRVPGERVRRIRTGAAADGGRACPFLEDGMCTVHEVRPFACRVFFCDRRSSVWQASLYESCQARVAAIHDRFDIPYRYGEWCDMLSRCAAAVPARRPLVESGRDRSGNGVRPRVTRLAVLPW